MVSKVTESNVPSATVISAKSDFLRLTGSTQIETIGSPLLGNCIVIWVTPVDGNIVLGTSGNILVGATLIQNRLYTLIFSKATNKWYIHGVV
jgi:hypothetical protein